MTQWLSRLAVLCVTVLMASGVQAADVPLEGYVVVVSQATRANPEWALVVETLQRQYGGTVLEYQEQPSEVLLGLRERFPRWTCFVVQPTEASRAFVAEVHQLTRQLDDDPYTDTRWGILTGYDAENALAIARQVPPLVVKKVASGTELALECCEQGECFDELVQHKLVRKAAGQAALELRGPGDTTKALVDALNDYQADLFVTSGHATERDWQIGFRYRNGTFRCADGQLFGLDTAQQRHAVASSNPKVYMAVGNCLMGHIDSRDAMALAWMNSAGVRQMIGYTVLTWYGYGGWGCLDYFVEQPGRYTFVEGFLANQYALVHRLQQPELNAGDREGLEYDQDVVAFYGDPAWEVRMADGMQRFKQTLTTEGDLHTLVIQPLQGATSFDTVNNNGSQRGGRPFVQFLEHRMQAAEILAGAELRPVITDDFVLVPRPEQCDPERIYRIVFRAAPVQ